MEKINKHNYEIFFIDYFDGSLSPDQTKDLFLFLELHPDLKEEFDAFEVIPVTKEDSFFPNKEQLKKDGRNLITHANYEEYCIAYAEEDLNEEEKKALLHFIEENKLQKQFDRSQQLKLQAAQETFDEKEGLKKLLIDQNEELNESSLDEYLVAYLEGDLSKIQEQNLHQFVQANDARKETYETLKNVYLHPQEYVFENKAAIKKFSLSVFSKRLAPFAAAAAILLLVVLLFSPSLNDTRQLSSVTPAEKKQAVKNDKKDENFSVKTDKEEIPVKKQKENETTPEDQKKNKHKEKQAPIRKKENITPIKKSNPVVSFEGKVQIAAMLDEKVPVPENPFLPDQEFEAILAQQSNQKQEKYYKLDELVAEKVKTDVLKVEEEKLSFWHLAQAGLRGISKLTGKEYELETGVDENGNVALMAFNSKNFEYSRTKK